MTTAATYTLDNAWEQARRRLRLLETCYDPGTIGRLEALGVGPGWRCLEVGAGGGSITRWLCTAVGSDGRVCAVDLDTRFVEEIDAGNLDVARLDVTTDPLPAGGFDLIHTRAVLLHLPQREQILDTLVAALRPGGWLLVEEADRYPLDALATGLYGQVVERGLAALTQAGADLEWARHLPARLQERGLDAIEADSTVALFEGGSPDAEFLRLTLVQLRQLVLAAGTTPDRLDQWDALLTEPGQWFPGFAVVAAWGRRPPPAVA
jgi:2-polyprenyl-3-methyl-5-hydroxy-6-metoxy-1,4-benzoquinol methylase